MQPQPQPDFTPEFPGYSPEERAVFDYFDGGQQVFGDPLSIRRRLEVHLGNVDRVLTACHAADFPGKPPAPADWEPAEPAIKAAAQARGELVEAVREAFRMMPFDVATGIGALESQCWDAFNKYEAYLNLKKNSTPT